MKPGWVIFSHSQLLSILQQTTNLANFHQKRIGLHFNKVLQQKGTINLSAQKYSQRIPGYCSWTVATVYNSWSRSRGQMSACPAKGLMVTVLSPRSGMLLLHTPSRYRTPRNIGGSHPLNPGTKHEHSIAYTWQYEWFCLLVVFTSYIMFSKVLCDLFQRNLLRDLWQYRAVHCVSGVIDHLSVLYWIWKTVSNYCIQIKRILKDKSIVSMLPILKTPVEKLSTVHYIEYTVYTNVSTKCFLVNSTCIPKTFFKY